MILSVGEILVDMIGCERNGVFAYERKAGGAPFNVACAVKRFGAESAFVGCVGGDIIGDYLVKFAQSRSLDYCLVARNDAVNTTLAFVDIDPSGERSFCFYRKNTADYTLPEIPDEVILSSSIVHIGSLMLSEKVGAEYAARLADRAHALGKTVSFDVNFRTDIFRDKAAAVKAYSVMLEKADIVKFSEDETAVFTEKYIEEKLGGKLVCISLGGAGSEWRFNGRRDRAASISVKPVDTTGAGDAFYAGVLSRLDGTQAKDWTDEFLNGVLRFGNVCGALNTLGRGAIDCLPTLDQIEQKLHS